MIELFKSKEDKVAAAADAHVKLWNEIKALDDERLTARAKVLEVEDSGRDPKSAERVLAEIDRRLELKRAALRAAEEAGLDATAEEVNREIAGLKKAESEFVSSVMETATQAFKNFYLSLAGFEACGFGDLARALRDSSLERGFSLGMVGSFDAHAGPRAAGAALAKAALEDGAVPDLPKQRQEINALRTHGAVPAGRSSNIVVGRWRRALGRKQNAAGIRLDPFRAWQKRERARELEARVS